MPATLRYFDVEKQQWITVLASDPVLWVGPEQPEGDEKLWADTDEPVPPPSIAWDSLTGKPNAFPTVELGPGPTDLNTLTTPGTYWETNSADVAAGAHWPTTRAAQVVVTASASGLMRTQTVTEYTRENPRQWIRTQYQGIWGAWQLVGIPIPEDLSTAHLDTFQKPGDYTQIFLSRATKAQGYPLEGIAGILTVRVWNPANGAIIQTYTPWTTDPVCKRTYYQGTWRPWVNMLGQTV